MGVWGAVANRDGEQERTEAGIRGHYPARPVPLGPPVLVLVFLVNLILVTLKPKGVYPMITIIQSNEIFEVSSDTRVSRAVGTKSKPRNGSGLRKPEDPREGSLRRSKKMLRRFVWCNFIKSRTSFLTLTFRDPKFTDYNLAASTIKGFFQRLSYHLYKSKTNKFKYILVPEIQLERVDPVWHFHVMLFDVPYLDSDMLSRVWGHGFVKINAIWNDARHCGNYLVKYFSKAYSTGFIPSRRRYYRSLNLKCSVKYKGDCGNGLFTFFFEKDGADYRQLYHVVDMERKFSYSVFEKINGLGVKS